MYVHAHLRYCEAAAMLGEADAFLDGLQIANPIAVTERLPHATPGSATATSPAATPLSATAIEAFAEWHRVREGTVEADGGWRIYSSGPGLYVQLLIGRLAGRRRQFGKRISDAAIQGVTFEWGGS